MSRPRRDLWALGAVLLATTLTYGRLAGFGFIPFDDPHYVTANPRVLGGLSLSALEWAWTTTHQGNWHPLTWMAHMLDVELFGASPGAHHAVNVAFHLLNVALLFLALARLTGSRWRSALVAALFALHPLHVESVAWIAERKDVLSTSFGFCALLAYAGYARRPRVSSYALVVSAFFLALLAKPMLVTLPLWLLLLDVWPLERWTAATDSRARRFLLLEKLPLLLLSALFAGIAVWAQRGAGAMRDLEALHLGQRAANALVACAAYLGKTIWPAGLSVYYPHPGSWGWPKVIGAAAVLAAVTGLVAWQRRRRPFLAVGWLWFLIGLVPVIGLVQVGSQAMADRYTYVPHVGLFLAAVWAVPERLVAERRRTAALVASVVLLALTLTTWRQVDHWRDGITLFRHALEVTDDNYVAHSNLGLALLAAGRPAEAAEQFRAGLSLYPADHESQANLGVALHHQGRTAEAIAAYRRALELRPGYTEALCNLGVAYADSGDDRSAFVAFRRALRGDPRHARSRYGLAKVLLRRGQVAAATRQLREAVAADPLLCAAHRDLAILLRHQGSAAEADDHARRARSCMDPRGSEPR